MVPLRTPAPRLAELAVTVRIAGVVPEVGLMASHPSVLLALAVKVLDRRRTVDR